MSRDGVDPASNFDNKVGGVEMLRVAPLAASGQVDLAERTIYGVSCAQAVEALGHGVMLDGKTIEQLVELGNATKRGAGVKCRYTHPGLSSDGMGKLLGRLRNWRREGDKAVADLHLSAMAAKSPDGDIGAYVLGLADEDPAALGMSVVISLNRVWVLEAGVEIPWRYGEKPPEGATTAKPIVRVKQLFACDVVDEPAANRDGLFSAASRWLWGTNQLAQEAFAELDRLLGAYDVTTERAFAFALRYFAARGVDPARQLNDEVGVVDGRAFSKELEDNMDNEVDEWATLVTSVEPGAESDMAVWAKAAARSATQAMIGASGLPAASRVRLAAQEYGSPEAVAAEIETEQAYIAKLQEDKTVGGLRPVVSQVVDTRDKLQSGMDWMLGAPKSDPPPPNLRSIREIYLYVTGDYNFRGIFDPDQAQLASATTTTLAGMAVNALNKAILLHYENMATWRWYEPVVSVLPHDGTTQDIQMIMVDGVANLPTVAEGAAYPEAEVGDSKESMVFSKRGQYVGITLEMIRRSNITRIQAIPRLLTLASLRTRSAAFATLFTQNAGVGPTLADDATALFHANHGYLGAAAFAPSEWAAARKRIWSQLIPGTGKKLGLWPTYGLFPIDLYDAAFEAFGYGSGDVGKPSTAGTAQTVNPYADARPGDPRPIPIAVPDWNDANDWAYLVDPRLHPVLCMAYANAPQGNGHPMPEIFEVRAETAGLMFTNDTLPVKVRDWWAYGVATYIGIGKNNVP